MPKLELDAVFEQKNDIARAVEDELEKVLFRPAISIFVTIILVNYFVINKLS